MRRGNPWISDSNDMRKEPIHMEREYKMSEARAKELQEEVG